MDDDPPEPVEQPRPDGAGSLAARHDIVRGEDRGRAEAPHPAPVELRTRQPLHVDDVRLERFEPREQPARARQVLDALEQQPQPRARRGPKEPAADRQEDLFSCVADGLGHRSVQERPGEQRHVVPAVRQRGGEPVVVGRRVRQRVDDGDAHQTRERK